ncbi:MAG: GNAT family N-acetyltransferase [Proteobacteria bacterium]|nr:GNAT family N-acetyltransferase [Sideroxydans sp.]MBU4045645.1 GNAT family N-acetyltransferase [Gammaproteobacteria bacterium]MBU4154371.1 GNAT family N-acetyltransferase [Pseudomonadota bacterium]
MSETIEFGSNQASEAEIAEHLLHCDADFVPPLSGRVEINDYVSKIARKATRFEAWSGAKLVGLVAAYCNDHEQRIAYITSVSVLKAYMGKGIAASLMKQCIEHAKTLGMRQISLEVASANAPAIGLYEKSGFIAGKANAPFITMNLYLKSGE